jgi:hypothetical protein
MTTAEALAFWGHRSGVVKDASPHYVQEGVEIILHEQQEYQHGEMVLHNKQKIQKTVTFATFRRGQSGIYDT